MIGTNNNSCIHELSWMCDENCGFANLFGEEHQKMCIELKKYDNYIHNIHNIDDIRSLFYKTK